MTSLPVSVLSSPVVTVERSGVLISIFAVDVFVVAPVVAPTDVEFAAAVLSSSRLPSTSFSSSRFCRMYLSIFGMGIICRVVEDRTDWPTPTVVVSVALPVVWLPIVAFVAAEVIKPEVVESLPVLVVLLPVSVVPGISVLETGVPEVDRSVVAGVVCSVVCGVMTTVGIVENVVRILLPVEMIVAILLPVVSAAVSIDTVEAVDTELLGGADVEVELKNKRQ